MVSAAVLGASGSLGQSLGQALNNAELESLGISRSTSNHWHGSFNHSLVVDRYEDVGTHFSPSTVSYFFFAMGAFAPRPFISSLNDEDMNILEANLLSPMLASKSILASSSTSPSARQDYVFIGSTSAYAGFQNTVSYCTAKFGLRGLVSALNDEYASSNTRFWLASMGTMNNELGAFVGAPEDTLLDVNRIAQSIVNRVVSADTEFEPEFVIRRRRT